MKVICHGCGEQLDPRARAENRGICTGCGEMVCYACGCTEGTACFVDYKSRDGQSSCPMSCSWDQPGLCTFCKWDMAYALYMQATERAPDEAICWRALCQATRMSHISEVNLSLPRDVREASPLILLE